MSYLGVATPSARNGQRVNPERHGTGPQAAEVLRGPKSGVEAEPRLDARVQSIRDYCMRILVSATLEVTSR